jgi:sugar O-acyltransferase (sialic acid O-acetyltransferase NeuD family)
MSRLVIFGLSNMVSDIFDCALARGHEIARIVRNQPERLRPRTKGLAERLVPLPSVPELLELESFTPGPDEIYVLGTTSPARTGLVDRLHREYGLSLATLVHPAAHVSPFARLGEGVFVGAAAVIAPGATIGSHVFINRGVTVGHDTVVESFARLQPGCNIGGHVRIGRGTTVGMGANVIEELEIGPGVMIAAGAVVIADVEPEVLVAGVPARVKKALASRAE